MGFYSQRFDSVQALRGIAAFSVILHHISLINNGAFGVDIFFCISGFIMMYVTELSVDHFISKRLVRIVPLYYAITFATYIGILVLPGLFEQTTANPMYLIKALLFIPYSISDMIQPLVRVGWTLNYEMFFYVVLWVAMFINRKRRAVIASAMLICLVIAGKLFDISNDIWVFWTDSILIEFIFGMLSYEILRRGVAEYAANSKIKRFLLLGVAVLCYVFMWIVRQNSMFESVDRCIVYGIPAFVLFVAAFIAGYKLNIPKPLVFLGDISYSVYLIHYFVIRFYDNLAGGTIIGAIVAIVLSIGLGAVSYYIFEKKLNKYLRLKLKI